jgi:hypothetical protein
MALSGRYSQIEHISCHETFYACFIEIRLIHSTCRVELFLEEKCFFGIYIYEGVEPIDLATLGVLSMVRRIAPEHPPVDAVRARYPGIDVQNAMLVDNGSIITGGGVTPCIDAALYILETCLGPEVAAETARMDHSRAQGQQRAVSFNHQRFSA